MTITKLASLIAKREGKKSKARIGDIREILGIMADITVESPYLIHGVLSELGLKRAKRKKK